MKNNEKELFFKLCSFQDIQRASIEPLLEEAATANVLGHLFMNRMQAVAYGVLKGNDLLGQVNREFRNSLSGAYVQNREKNKSFFRCLEMLSDILIDHSDKFAMLKGALLCGIYPEGYRTSNDIDLLVRPKDVTAIGDALSNAGFRQGKVQNNKFIPASRREVIASKMMRGETVPYILEVGLPFMQFFEVDINFSLDYKNSDTDTLSDMLGRTIVDTSGKQNIVTLAPDDFFIHLCSHLYKEATTFPWIKMNRDMTLYKFCDIYMLLHSKGQKEVQELYQRAEQLGMTNICSAAILWTSALFDIENTYALEYANADLSGKESFLHEVIAPAEHTRFTYIEKNIRARFFSEDRSILLKETIECAN